YSNLTIDGGAASVFSFPANLTSINTLTLNNSITSLAGFNLTATTLVNNATLRLQGNETVTLTTMDVDSGTVQYVGRNIAENLTINDTNVNKATFQSGAAKVIAGALNITSGTYDANGQTSTVTGLTTVNGGTYTSGGATQTFNGGLTESSGTFTGAAGTITVV